MQNFMDLDMENISDPKALTLEIWGLKTSLWQFGPKALCNRLIKPLVMRTLASIFKRPHFLRNHGMNPIKLWDLRKIIDLWTWYLKTIFGPIGPGRYPAVSLESWLQFSQTSPFLKNCEESPVKLSNLKKIYWPWDLGPRN